jgi:hypothetical protein
MGLRFRRSVKIMPGVRLNFSAQGMSTTIGPRGSNVNLGSRGAFLNVGLLGTGLSYRSRLTGTAAEPAQGAAEPLYVSRRSVSRSRKQEEREVLRDLARDLHADREAKLEALRGVLRSRSTETVDWLDEYGSLGPYQPQPFVPPLQAITADQILQEVGQANPLKPWIISALAALACAALAPQLWLRIPALALAIYFGLQAYQLGRKRPQVAAELLKAREEEHARNVEAAKSEHEREEAIRADRHDQEEALRTRVREAVVTEDAEILATVLEVELSYEDLPVPVDFDLEFDGIRRVQLEVALPTMDAIPLTVSSVTKTGKFSERKMAQRDRVDLYKDVCAGLALRLVHEVLRVLPFVEHVRLAGMITGPDPATGQTSRYVALRLSTDRGPFLGLALDHVDASEALAHLGGEMKTKRDGTFQPLEVAHGA